MVGTTLIPFPDFMPARLDQSGNDTQLRLPGGFTLAFHASVSRNLAAVFAASRQLDLILDYCERISLSGPTTPGLAGAGCALGGTGNRVPNLKVHWIVL